LPISRLQRDLTDSTVLRNIGVPFAHTILSFKSIEKGLNKLVLNSEKIYQDLEQNWAVVAEAIQTILRRENYPDPYETLRNFTRGKNKITKESIQQFIDTLNISSLLKKELKRITPHNYTVLNQLIEIIVIDAILGTIYRKGEDVKLKFYLNDLRNIIHHKKLGTGRKALYIYEVR